MADSISVDIPRNFYMAKHYLQKYSGKAVSVTDGEILDASIKLSQAFGLFTEPASAAAFAGYLKLLDSHQIEKSSKNVVLLTGSGLKDIAALKSAINLPDSIAPNLDHLKKLLS